MTNDADRNAETTAGTAPGAASAPPLTRRDAILHVTRLLGGAALVGGSGLLAGCADTATRAAVAAGGVGELSAADVALLDEIAETILPETSTPGAKAARTGAFIALMVAEAYDPRERRVFLAGMRRIERACRRMHGVSFVDATPEQRLAVLEPLDREQKAEADAREAARRERLRAVLAAPPGEAPRTAPPSAAPPPPHYFRMMKELTLLGYFTSEIGYTQAMRYVESPGRFDPCVPYTAGEKIWAAHA